MDAIRRPHPRGHSLLPPAEPSGGSHLPSLLGLQGLRRVTPGLRAAGVISCPSLYVASRVLRHLDHRRVAIAAINRLPRRLRPPERAGVERLLRQDGADHDHDQRLDVGHRAGQECNLHDQQT